MLPPSMMGGEPDGSSGPTLGSSRPTKSEDDEMDPEKWLKDGEANVEWAKEMLKRLQVEGTDIRRGAVVLGDVAATFPRMTAA